MHKFRLRLPDPLAETPPFFGRADARIGCGCGRVRGLGYGGNGGYGATAASAARTLGTARRCAARWGYEGLPAHLERIRHGRLCGALWRLCGGGRAARPCPPAARHCRPGLAASLRSAYRRVLGRALLPAWLFGGWPSCGHRHGVRGWAQVLRVSPIRIPIKGKCGISHRAKSSLGRPRNTSQYATLKRRSQA